MSDTNASDTRNRIGIDFDPELAGPNSKTSDEAFSDRTRLHKNAPAGSSETHRQWATEPSTLRNGIAPHAVLRSDSQICVDSLDGWQNFELMPPDYRSRRQARRTLHHWSSAILVLLSITIGSATALWAQGRRMNRRNAQLVDQARPLGDLRRRTQVIETENLLLKKWCAWVESAEPDDCVVQVLGAAAHATHQDSPQTPSLDVHSVEVKLPREYGVSVSTPPTWAKPNFRLVVSTESRELLVPWTARLEHSGRLKSIKLATPRGNWQQALIQVNAEPLSTRTVP